ncbi:hypothetical protein LOTGIDRAFT_195020 [Lottia gigantea]|uniref:Fatty acid 2-hydroxylase n=1 Tax=Lottia gigantea TaxID=225164 RepID=V3Z6X6_LOTGI|nr:hypothetical protein LOTGIDRAFT_195020 [Lottia gigantea]ESO86578.1 hypothetical protein LOTGIDRAFT_195020 [Lottia gigantea]
MPINTLNFRKSSDNKIRVIHNGKLYDITNFSSNHPGGQEILQKHSEQDVTLLMKNETGISGHKHSRAAYDILKKYYVGDATDVNKNGHFHTNLEEKEDLVDWNKPLFHQVGFLGENYHEWVHHPVEKRLRLFSYDLFEFFNSSPWWMVPIYWIPISILLIYFSHSYLTQQPEYIFIVGLFDFKGIEINGSALPIIITMGILLWSLVEYVIHRWVFHVKPPSWSPWLIRLHFLFHGQHHKAPMDKSKLVFPQLPASFLASQILLIYCLLLPTGTALALFAGTIIGYMFYDLTHYYLHHGTPSLTYYKSLKTYHMKHHFNDHSTGFGISSKLWDYPFKTLSSCD